MNFKKKLFLGITLLSSVFLFSSCKKQNIPNLDINLQSNGQEAVEQNTNLNLDMPNQTSESVNSSADYLQEENLTVELKTSRGVITLDLFPKIAPNTVNNFITKAESGYYEGLIFHRVEDWVIQGGDPLGTGTGGGQMPTELSKEPFKEGSLGVARGGNIEISNDSQFFICTDDCSWLTGQYTVFGQVTKGMDIAKSTQIGDKIISLTLLSKTGSDSSGSTESGELLGVENQKDDQKPIIYHSLTCGHCKVVLDYLEENDLTKNYTLKEVGTEENSEDMRKKAEICGLDTSQGLGVPMLFDSGKCPVGDQPIIDYIES